MGSKASRPGLLALQLAGRLGGAVLGTSLAGPLGTALGAMAVGPICELLATKGVTDQISEAFGNSVEAVTANLSTDWISDEWRRLENSRDAALNEDLARALITAMREAVASLPDIPDDIAGAWDKRFKWALEHPRGRRDFLRSVAREQATPGEWDQAFVGRLHRPRQLVDWLWSDIRRELESAATGSGCSPAAVAPILDRPTVRETLTDRLQSAFGAALQTDEAALKKLHYYMQLVLAVRLDRQDTALDEIKQQNDGIRQQLAEAFEELPDKLADRVADKVAERLGSDERLPRNIARHFRRELAGMHGPAAKPDDDAGYEKFVFYPPGIAQGSRFGAAFQPFYFALEEDKFVGRESVLEELRRELLTRDDDAPGFRWAAICGDAGSGKSRLALRILETEKRHWPFSGFVRSDFLAGKGPAKGDLGKIGSPALFVIDYAGSAPEVCCRFLERCALFAQDAPFPVRALLLLRRSNDRFFELVARGDDDALASNTQIRFDPPADRQDNPSGALFLGGLSDDETETLMRSRITRALDEEGGDPPADVAASDLLALLRRYDETRRPLFAIMVADLLARGVLPQEAKGDASQEESRLALFWDYLDHQFKRRWNSASDVADPATAREQVDRHLTFLALSTMCRGLTDEAWARLYQNPRFRTSVATLLPRHPEDFDSPVGSRPSADFNEDHTLATLCGSARRGMDDPYPILEPDLVGEALVLLMLREDKTFLCENKRTADYRRKFLREYAWSADPAGAAFFSVLTTQDFPEHAAAADWLLPEKPGDEVSPDLATPFRSLVLTTIAPLQTRAATREDLKRMARLLDRFPPDPTAPIETQIERADGVIDLAEQLAFVVNKGVSPSGFGRPVPVQDKLGKRHLEFNTLATESETTEAAGDGQAIFRLSSDADTVAGALTMLRRMYDDAVEPAMSEGNFELRRRNAKILCHALSSVFWRYRNDERKFGFAATPLSSEEQETRAHLGERCRALVAPERRTQDSVAIASLVTRILIYAEHGEDPRRGREVVEAIQALSAAGDFSHGEAISAALGALDNYAYLQISPQQGDKESGVDSLEDISATSDRLLEAAASLDELSEATRKWILGSWCRIGTRVAHFDRDRERPLLAYLRARTERYRALVARQGRTPVTYSAIDLFDMLFDACHQEGGDAQSALVSFADLVEANGIDHVSLNYQSWDNLRHHFWQLRRVSMEGWPRVASTIKLLMKQVGDRAQNDLADMLISVLPDTEATPGRDPWLAELAQGGEPLTTDVDCRLRIAMVAQSLIDGDDYAAQNELERTWTAGTEEDERTRRTAALVMLRVLALWHGAGDPRVAAWRQRLLKLVEPATGARSIDPGQRNHDLIAMETAACVARMEIAAGKDTSDWLQWSKLDD
ncbi:hypothetical protein ABI59_16475 [Acidobacteria bacterium Mor1]|nr:hypothetical protein ABI59_16475 [Acidobacteria bacterium Mor1]